MGFEAMTRRSASSGSARAQNFMGFARERFRGMGRYATARLTNWRYLPWRGSSRKMSTHVSSAADASMLMRAISLSLIRLKPGAAASGLTGFS
jgi:hypothetical protein